MPRGPDPYGTDVLDEANKAKARAAWPPVAATPGLLVQHRTTGHRGKILRLEAGLVTIRGELGGERVFRLSPGAFQVDGKAVTLVAPVAAREPAAPARTASGSIAAPKAERVVAKVARGSRLLVEGVHDAALVERVWGDDLRDAGVVVEPLHGIDDLAAVVEAFAPDAGNRLGVLVDHLVPGSKETRLVEQVRSPHVLVAGIPYVDIWQAVKPAAVGIPAWPDVPKGQSWKQGVCRALGVSDEREMWRRVLAGCRSWTDLETPLVHAVESLLDFVLTAPE
jgi:hypothetical protein